MRLEGVDGKTAEDRISGGLLSCCKPRQPEEQDFLFAVALRAFSGEAVRVLGAVRRQHEMLLHNAQPFPSVSSDAGGQFEPFHAKPAHILLLQSQQAQGEKRAHIPGQVQVSSCGGCGLFPRRLTLYTSQSRKDGDGQGSLICREKEDARVFQVVQLCGIRRERGRPGMAGCGISSRKI